MNATIRLRDVEAGDLALIFEHQRDPIAVAMVAFHSRDAMAFAEHWTKLLADPTILKKTVIVDGQVAGHIGSWTSDGKREIGYWLDRAFWGRGIATEAISAYLLLEPIRPLHAEVAQHNTASLRVLHKCGFTISHVIDATPHDTEVARVLLTLGQ
jgi:RimJ/RimL family protein N-acetyltransferase